MLSLSFHNVKAIRFSSIMPDNVNCLSLSIEVEEGWLRQMVKHDLTFFGLPKSTTDVLIDALAKVNEENEGQEPEGDEDLRCRHEEIEDGYCSTCGRDMVGYE